MKSRKVGELRGKREETVVSDKSVGNSCEMLDNTTIEAIQVEKKNAANDALLVEVEDKVIVYFDHFLFCKSICSSLFAYIILSYHNQRSIADNYLFVIIYYSLC